MQELFQQLMADWGERCCNNVKYVKYNVFFAQPSVRSFSSTPPKQNQDFVTFELCNFADLFYAQTATLQTN